MFTGVSLFFQTYALYFRIALVAVVLGATAYFSAHWATQIERSSWEEKESKRTSVVINDYKASGDISQASGVKYAKKAAAVQSVVNTPDRNLDAEMQTSVGDVVIPGDLGVRLNSIASAGGDQTSEGPGSLDSSVSPGNTVPHSVSAASGVEADTGSKYRIGYRLPLEAR